MSALTDSVRAAAARHAMFPEGTPVVVMVSGGPDSVALLRLLADGDLGPLALSVLHVDHGLRADSAADAEFVSGLAAELGVPCRVVAFDVAAFAAERGLNLEDAGRQVRYRFAAEELDAACAAAGVEPARGRIATAHTLDDRIETLLMRLVTGAGTGALASIRHVRGRIVRPLLDARRSDVLEHLAILGQAWRDDPTNADTTRMRARVRHDVVPVLDGLNPRLGDALLRTFAIAEDEDALLDEMTRAFLADFAEVEPGEARLDRSRASTLSRPMVRRLVRAALADAFPDVTRIDFEHVEAIVEGIGSDGFSRDLPGGLRAHDEYGRLVLSRAAGQAAGIEPALLPVPGEADLGAAGVIAASPASPDMEASGPNAIVIDADAVRGSLTVDGAHPGDRLRPLGMSGTKKVSDLLGDAKVPKRHRPCVPVVRDGDRIVWVAGVRMSEEYRIGPRTVRAVRLEWSGPTERADGWSIPTSSG